MFVFYPLRYVVELNLCSAFMIGEGGIAILLGPSSYFTSNDPKGTYFCQKFSNSLGNISFYSAEHFCFSFDNPLNGLYAGVTLALMCEVDLMKCVLNGIPSLERPLDRYVS